MLYLKLIVQKVCFILSKIMSILFSAFPIQKNKVFLYSYRGNKYACNQKGFTEYIMNLENNELDLVWGYRNENTKSSIPTNIKKVKMCTLSYFYNLYTSKYVCTNQRVSCLDFFTKRKGQIYIQTWHASAGLKNSEEGAQDDLTKVYINEAIRDSKMSDYVVAGSRQLSDFYQSSFWYKGPLLEIGTMRNDIFFNVTDELKQNIKAKYNLPLDRKIILYAPTFRNNSIDLSIDYSYDYGMDFKKIHNAFLTTIGDNLIILKQHPNLIDHKRESSEFFIDMTEMQDIQELLLIADILITDYSSVMFDYLLMKRPLFIFAKDFSVYSRDFLLKLEDMPCSISKTNEELIENIIKYNHEKFLRDLDSFDKEYIGSFENGKASEKLYNFILNLNKE